MKIIQSKIAGFILILFVFQACKQQEDSKIENSCNQNIKLTKLLIDSVFCKSPAFTEKGFFSIAKDSIYYIDYSYSLVSIFDAKGKMLGRKLGKGDGPDESENINKYVRLKDGRHFIVHDFIFNIYDNNWIKTHHSKMIDFAENISLKELESDPRPDMKAIYEFDWMNFEDNGLLQLDSNTILFPIKTYHPRFNGYQHENYYKEARIFGKLAINTGKVTSVFGRKSIFYQRGKLYPNFDFFHFTVRRDTTLVAFAIDPTIYEYVGENLVSGFGCAGKEIKNQKYTSYSNYKEADRNIEKDLSKRGHYAHLYYDNTKNLLFRSYNRGDHRGGLQIYQGKTLVGDLSVPFHFKVIGSIKNQYYAEGIKDEINERLGLYTFLLPKL